MLFKGPYTLQKSGRDKLKTTSGLRGGNFDLFFNLSLSSSVSFKISPVI